MFNNGDCAQFTFDFTAPLKAAVAMSSNCPFSFLNSMTTFPT